MKFDISDRNINRLEALGKKVKIKLKNGDELLGVPDCICWLPDKEDENIDEEVLKFDIVGSVPVFITEKEIESFSIIE